MIFAFWMPKVHVLLGLQDTAPIVPEGVGQLFDLLGVVGLVGLLKFAYEMCRVVKQGQEDFGWSDAQECADSLDQIGPFGDVLCGMDVHPVRDGFR